MTFARITNATFIEYSAKRLAAFHGFPYIAGVDILPLDTIPEEEGEREAYPGWLSIPRKKPPAKRVVYGMRLAAL